MVGYYIGEIGYYEGDKIDYRDTEVPQRPSADYKWDGKTWVIDEGVVKAREAENAKAKLAEIDLKSIRGIREWIASQPTAPKIVKEYETEAIEERAKL